MQRPVDGARPGQAHLEQAAPPQPQPLPDGGGADGGSAQIPSPTWPTKTGFRDGDPRLEKLFAWLRANVPPIVPQESVKKRLTRALAEQKQAEPNVIRVVLEKSTYCSLDLRVKICLSAGIRRRCMSPRRGPARPRPDSGSSG